MVGRDSRAGLPRQSPVKRDLPCESILRGLIRKDDAPFPPPLPLPLRGTLLCAAIAGVQGVHTATLVVTSTADSGTGSLRQALADAIDGDTIQFDAALNGQAITLTTDELVIDKSITITGPGSSQLAVQRSFANGTPSFRIFHITPGHTVMIEGLTIKSGRNFTASGAVCSTIRQP